MINGMLGIILFVVTTSVKAISSMEDNTLGLEKNISIGNATQGNRGDRNIPIFNVISFPNRFGIYKLIAVQSIILKRCTSHNFQSLCSNVRLQRNLLHVVRMRLKRRNLRVGRFIISAIFIRNSYIERQLFLCWTGWQKLRGSMGGTRRKVWTRTKILSPNIRYFVAN